MQIFRRTLHVLLIVVSVTGIWWVALITLGILLGKVLPHSIDFLITIPLSAYIGYWLALRLHQWDKPAYATRLDRILIQVGIVVMMLLTLSLGFRRGSS
jgi:hypothetical protein